MDAIGAIRVQREMLEELSPQHQEGKMVAFVCLFGGDIREIIDTFPRATGKDPGPADIIWCLGVRIQRDPGKVIQELVCEELVAQDHANN